MKNLFEKYNAFIVISADTDCGKTILSASLMNYYANLFYLKPIQAGLENTDTNFIKKQINEKRILPELYLLKKPCSPHYASKLEGITIDPNYMIENIKTHLSLLINSDKEKRLLIETAGGIYSPITDDFFVIDLLRMLVKIKIIPIISINCRVGMISQSLMLDHILSNANIDYLYIFNNKADDKIITESCLFLLNKLKGINIGYINNITNLDNKESYKIYSI